ncbi:hypothetical protein [Paenibacillus jiagnxiensis]
MGYYATITTAIQKIFAGESDDMQAILDEAAETDQRDFFDKIEFGGLK